MEKIKLGHGAGGDLMKNLVEEIVSSIDLKKTEKGFGLDRLEDAGIVDLGDKKIALTTDSYTVDPLFFPGGDIGTLAVCGTVNDLAVMGAEPLALTLAYIIEEGFPLNDLKRVTDSVNHSSKAVGVPIITGDSKVIEHGKMDKLIVNTAGIGIVKQLVTNHGANPGDKILVSGSVGDHGLALLAKRFDFDTDMASDCAPIWEIVKRALEIGGISAMKDPTRGGLANCLNELAEKSSRAFFVKEKQVPLKEKARSIGEILGIDPLQTASEGRVVMCVKPERADDILETLKKFDEDASVIGHVEKEPKGKVILETVVGGRRFLEPAIGELYPRIC
ncbi:hydrogenase expression/formation protein HypE [archaeon]|nr:hydrogenase expression/formation protein HypE [archaeon]